MSLIDQSYFIRELSLPVSGKYDSIQDYIDRYEPEIIRLLFGQYLGNLVLDYENVAPPQRIKDIVEGVEYIPAGYEFPIKWGGLVNAEKRSLIANYVYYKYCAEKEIQITQVAGIKPLLENADSVSYEARAYSAWNQLVEMYGYRHQDSRIPSLFNYMQQHSDLYPEWVFSSIMFRNTLGI